MKKQSSYHAMWLDTVVLFARIEDMEQARFVTQLQCKDVVIEIRAFDTSYFEVYTDDLSLRESLIRRFVSE